MSEDMEYTYEFLRKCHGLRFKARRHRYDIEGIVKVERESVVLCYGKEMLGSFDYFHRERGVQITPTSGFREAYVTDFEIVPRDPDTYKDWQVGDVLVDNDSDERFVIVFRCGELVFKKREDDNHCSPAYTCDELFENGFCLELTDTEKQILDAEKKCLEVISKTHAFKKGDLVLVRDKDYDLWRITAFLKVTNISEYPYRVTNGDYGGIYRFCIPYNEDTKHLLGTSEDYKKGER